jgi:UDP-N-acetylmuramoylalanine--D-glutamate ligase
MTPNDTQRTPQSFTASAHGRTVVMGVGRTGLSCARYLHKSDIPCAFTDSREHPPEAESLEEIAPNAQVRFGAFDIALLDGASDVVVSPGISLREPFVQEALARGIPVIGDIELFARAAKAPIAAVTGTNGKSTVTTLLANMANAAGRRAFAGGNLGRPALDLLDDAAPDLYVLELSSFQLDTTQSLATAAATVLNVTPDHMDRYATLAEYAQSKARILDRCAVGVVNCDDAAVRTMGGRAARTIGFSLQRDPSADFYASHIDNDVVLMHGERALVRMSELRITGLHNAANALAALAMASALNFAVLPCVQALREFPGLPHRSQWVADVGGVRFVDDSKGTNVGATLAAVAGMAGSLVVIAGGQGKGQDFAPLAAAFRDKVRHVVLLGQDAAHLARVLDGVCTVQLVRDMNEAVQAAASAAQAGETVLLSPACASLDMFRDYAHRGDVFAAAVRGLQA